MRGGGRVRDSLTKDGVHGVHAASGSHSLVRHHPQRPGPDEVIIWSLESTQGSGGRLDVRQIVDRLWRFLPYIHAVPPVRVAVSDPHELVVAGIGALLARFPDRVELLDWSDCAEADVVLYGVDAEKPASHDAGLHQLLRNTSAQVFAFGWNKESPGALAASACGVHGFAHKQLTAEQLVDLIEVAHDTRSHRRTDLSDDSECHPEVLAAGLTRRESQVLSLIASGLSNGEIADALYLSINSIKTYIRSAYHKIGVQRRSQAVLWATRHGLAAAPVEEAAPLLRRPG